MWIDVYKRQGVCDSACAHALSRAGQAGDGLVKDSRRPQQHCREMCIRDSANPVLVLSYSYWKTRFAASRDVVGQTVLINGHAFTVLGVAPQNFDSAIGGYRPGVFIPISMVDIAMPWMAPRENLTNHQSIWLTLVARLKPGVTAAQAQASLAPLWHSLRAYEPVSYTHLALAGSPSILLADEPTGNLDSKNGEAVMHLLADLHREGSTICMVTHDPRFAKHAEREVHLFDGKVVSEDELKKLTEEVEA